MKKGLGIIAMAAALMADFNAPMDRNSKTSINDIDFTPKQPPIPKGAKRYSFYENEFTCIAINEKSAKKKYEKWLKSKLSKL